MLSTMEAPRYKQAKLKRILLFFKELGFIGLSSPASRRSYQRKVHQGAIFSVVQMSMMSDFRLANMYMICSEISIIYGRSYRLFGMMCKTTSNKKCSDLIAWHCRRWRLWWVSWGPWCTGTGRGSSSPERSTCDGSTGTTRYSTVQYSTVQHNS